MDPLNLILLIIVVIIGWRLRSLLGTRHDDEQPGSRADAYRLNRDAFDNKPESATQADQKDASQSHDQTNNETSEQANGEPAQDQTSERGEHKSQDKSQDKSEDTIIAMADKQAEEEARAPIEGGRGLAYLREVQPDFDESGFLDGAARAYEMILTAFAEDDLSAVMAFLGPDVESGFNAAIAARRDNGQQLVTRILRLDRPALDDARIEAGRVQLDVRFRAEIISFTQAADSPIDEDNLPPPASTHDIWVFERPLDTADPNWQLIATHGA